MLMGEFVDWRPVRSSVRGLILELRREEILVVSVVIRAGELVLAVHRSIRLGELVLMVDLLRLRLGWGLLETQIGLMLFLGYPSSFCED